MECCYFSHTGLSKTQEREHTSHETYVYGTLLQIAQGPNNICWDWHNRPLEDIRMGNVNWLYGSVSCPHLPSFLPFHSLKLCPLGIKLKERKMRHQPERLEGVPGQFLYSNQLCKDMFEGFFFLPHHLSIFALMFCLIFFFENCFGEIKRDKWDLQTLRL